MDYLTYPYNQNSFTSGLDHPFKAKDFIHFCSYPYPISYKYNDRGFRDDAWPTNLNNVIWCIGDSFTKGIGVPFLHTWPSRLQQKTGIRCLNLGLDGASNSLLSSITTQLVSQYSARKIVIMWSYLHRRHKDPWNFLQFEDNSDRKDDIANFLSNYHLVNSLSSNTFNILIPKETAKDIPHNIQLLSDYPTLDLGRDGHHFDKNTSDFIVDNIVSHFDLPLANT